MTPQRRRFETNYVHSDVVPRPGAVEKGSDMIEEEATGAADWRSEAEKQKSMLRKACASLFKTWIPDHPEAQLERGEVPRNWRDAMLDGTMPGITLESMLSQGSEDVLAHDYHEQALSMQELLVQREGSDAFLDPKNALRVVRRKFSMMTLVSRMASTMEQRNIAAISIKGDIPVEVLTKFGRLLAARVDGTALEEENEFKKKMRRGKFDHVEVLYHSEMIGRRLPVPWRAKHAYTLIGRAMKRGEMPETATDRVAANRAPHMPPKVLRQLLLYADDVRDELDAPGAFDPIQTFLMHAEERALLNATRNIFNEYQELRSEASHARAMHSTTDLSVGDLMGGDDELSTAEVQKALDDDFLADADQDDDDFLRLAKGLELVRKTRGPEFFSRITMVSGDVSFVATALGSGFAEVEHTVVGLDPVEGLRKAQAVTEPYYRARGLSAVVPHLLAGGHEEEAEKAAEEAFAAARKCHTADVDQAYTAALTALLAVGHEQQAGLAVSEALERAHDHKDDEERAASLMRVVSTLMEAGPLPPSVRTTLSRAIVGADVHFWGKKDISSPLVEVILSLLTGDDVDTMIFLQKVIVHPNVDVRKSVIRSMPFDTEELRGILLGHLRDTDVNVRVDVAERIGYSGDRKLALYLQNHVRQNAPDSLREKRAMAMNLARLDPERFTPLFNAMLGKYATEGQGLTDKFKPLKDDDDWRLAGLEVLYFLNSQQAKRLIFNVEKKVKGSLKPLVDQMWAIIKAKPYGDPTLPRSSHDPEWTEDQSLGLGALLERDARAAGIEEEADPDLPPEEQEADVEAAPKRKEKSTGGLFSRIKSKIFGGDGGEETQAIEAVRDDAGEGEGEGEGGDDAQMTPGEATMDAAAPSLDAPPGAPSAAYAPPAPPKVRTYAGDAKAAMRFQAMLMEGEGAWSGAVPMTFALYGGPEEGMPFWQDELHTVIVQDGSFEVLLGVTDGNRLPDALPTEVWLGINVDGNGEMQPRTSLTRARSVVQG